MGYDNKMMRQFIDMAKQSPKRVVFAEANHANMLQAAATAVQEGVCYPILLGNEERIEKLAKQIGIDLEGMQIVNLRSDVEAERRDKYAKLLTQKRQREGITLAEARNDDGRSRRRRRIHYRDLYKICRSYTNSD